MSTKVTVSLIFLLYTKLGHQRWYVCFCSDVPLFFVHYALYSESQTFILVTFLISIVKCFHDYYDNPVQNPSHNYYTTFLIFIQCKISYQSKVDMTVFGIHSLARWDKPMPLLFACIYIGSILQTHFCFWRILMDNSIRMH